MNLYIEYGSSLEYLKYEFGVLNILNMIYERNLFGKIYWMGSFLEDNWWFRRLNRGLGFLQGDEAVRRILEGIFIW